MISLAYNISHCLSANRCAMRNLHWCYTLTALLSANQNRVNVLCVLLRDLSMPKTIKTEIQGGRLHTLSAEFNEWYVTVTTVINQTDTHCPSPDLSRQTVTVLPYLTLTTEYRTFLKWRS